VLRSSADLQLYMTVLSLLTYLLSLQWTGLISIFACLNVCLSVFHIAISLESYLVLCGFVSFDCICRWPIKVLIKRSSVTTANIKVRVNISIYILVFTYPLT